jgi:LysM repeat protein
MTARRLLLTTGAMAGIATAIRAVTPAPGELFGVLAGAPDVVTNAAAEDLVLAAAGLLAWVAWGWGTLGLLLTAASGAPGALSLVCDRLARRLVPAGLRSTMAVALGIGLGVASPAIAAAAPAGVAAAPAPAPAPAPAGVATAATGTADVVPDWPAREPAPPPVPEWPTASPDERHVVAAGDCLWSIAAQRLTDTTGSAPSDAAVSGAVDDWWRANRGVIGPDADLIHPGQVLRPPSDERPLQTDPPTSQTRTSDTPGSSQ